MTEERWKPVVGYEEYYKVSTKGNIYSIRSERNLKPIDDGGYLFINLSVKGARKKYPVHRMVAEAFLCNEENKTQVNHKNGNPGDNRLDNLEWATPSENSTHAVNTGLAPTREGIKNGFVALTELEVMEILVRYVPYCRVDGCTAMAREFGVSTSAVHSIVTGRTWTHINPPEGVPISGHVRRRGQ